MSSLSNNCPTVNHWFKCDILGWLSEFLAALHIYNYDLGVEEPFDTSYDALCVSISLETTLPIYAFDNPEDSNSADLSLMNIIRDYERRMKLRPWITDEHFRSVDRPWITGDTLPFYHCRMFPVCYGSCSEGYRISCPAIEVGELLDTPRHDVAAVPPCPYFDRFIDTLLRGDSVLCLLRNETRFENASPHDIEYPERHDSRFENAEPHDIDYPEMTH